MHRVFREGYSYRSVMVSLSGLTDVGLQQDLFEDPVRLKKEADLCRAFHKINNRYGRDTITLAAAESAICSSAEFFARRYTQYWFMLTPSFLESSASVL